MRLSDCGSAADIRRTAQTRERGRLQDGLGASGLKHGAADAFDLKTVCLHPLEGLQTNAVAMMGGANRSRGEMHKLTRNSLL
jgi:hypothetical protein